MNNTELIRNFLSLSNIIVDLRESSENKDIIIDIIKTLNKYEKYGYVVIKDENSKKFFNNGYFRHEEIYTMSYLDGENLCTSSNLKNIKNVIKLTDFIKIIDFLETKNTQDLSYVIEILKKKKEEI